MINNLKNYKKLQIKKLQIKKSNSVGIVNSVTILVALLALLIGYTNVNAQNPAGNKVKEFTNKQDSVEIYSLMMGYLTNKDTVSTIETIRKYVGGKLIEKTAENGNILIRPNPNFDLAFSYLYSVHPTDSMVLAKVIAPVDYTKLFGWFELDWYFFLTKNENKEWRISEIRTQSENQKMYSMVKVMDTDTGMPPMLKPLIVREQCGTLLSNRQLKEIFDNNKKEFNDLAIKINSIDSLNNIARIDNKVVLVNRTALDWGEAAEDMPKEAIDWMMLRLNKVGQKNMQKDLKRIAKIRQQGIDTLKSVANMYKINLADINEITQNMQKLRIITLGKTIKSKGVIQFITGGTGQDLAGFIYSPKGFLPSISPDEYFCLEELDKNWWIFRRT